MSVSGFMLDVVILRQSTRDHDEHFTAPEEHCARCFQRHRRTSQVPWKGFLPPKASFSYIRSRLSLVSRCWVCFIFIKR